MTIDCIKAYGRITLSILMMLFILTLPILAEDIFLPEQVADPDVTLELSYRDEDTALVGAQFDLYRMADVDSLGSLRFTLTQTFQASGVAVNGLDSSGWRNAANTLAGYVQLNGISPLDSGKTDSNGSLVFPTINNISMKQGLYLVIGKQHVQNGRVYTAEPFLVFLPMRDETGSNWLYEGIVSPKHTSKPTTPDIPDIPQDPEVDRKVIKVWDDEGYEHNRPEQITVVLLQNGKVYERVTLNAANRWTYRWENLDAGDTWTVVEETVPAGYTVSVKQEGITFVITNTYHPVKETEDWRVYKVWDDGSGVNRPEQVVIELLREGQVYDTVVLNEANGWQKIWYDLEADVYWSVREKNVAEGYTSKVSKKDNTFLVTNTLEEPETVSRQVIKIWKDTGYEQSRPKEISVDLLRNGEVYDTVVLNAENGWMYSWNTLEKDCTWSIRERQVPENYTAEIVEDGITFLITNTYQPPYTPPEPVDRIVQKIWKDEGHEAERPKEIQVILLRDGEVYETVILNEANQWNYQWTDLDGTYEWTVEELTELDKYTSSVTRDGNTFLITNTYSEIPQTGQLWWPVPILIALGMGLIVLGLLRRRGAYEED